MSEKLLNTKHCVGCEDNFYNDGREGGCWGRRTAKIIPRQQVGINDMPVQLKDGSWGHTTPYSKKPSCYRKRGYVFYDKKEGV